MEEKKKKAGDVPAIRDSIKPNQTPSFETSLQENFVPFVATLNRHFRKRESKNKSRWINPLRLEFFFLIVLTFSIVYSATKGGRVVAEEFWRMLESMSDRIRTSGCFQSGEKFH